MPLPALQEIPTEHSDFDAFGDFVHKYNTTELFHDRWGAGYAERASELDEELTRQLQIGQGHPQATVEELLLCFCRMWVAAPYLGIDSLEAFLRNPRALWLLNGIRLQIPVRG